MKTSLKKGFILTACLILLMWPLPGFAAVSGLVSISAHYEHPLNGQIEDPGNNAGLGQGMADSVLSPQGLYEEDDAGNAWLTIRLNLADQIGATKISVQNRGDASFYAVSSTEMQRTATTVDLRFPVTNNNDILRIDMYVAPMERSVIFYGALSGALQEGHGDFITSTSASSGSTPENQSGGGGNSGNEQENPAPASAPATNQTNPTTNAKTTSAAVGNKPKGGNEKKASGLGEKVESKPVAQGISDTKLSGKHGLLTKDSPEVLALKGQATGEGTPWGVWTSALVIALVVVLVLLTFSLVVAMVAVFFGHRWLRRQNDWKEAAIYDAEDLRT